MCDCASESDAEMLRATVPSKLHVLLLPLVYFTTITSILIGASHIDILLETALSTGRLPEERCY